MSDIEETTELPNSHTVTIVCPKCGKGMDRVLTFTQCGPRARAVVKGECPTCYPWNKRDEKRAALRTVKAVVAWLNNMERAQWNASRPT